MIQFNKYAFNINDLNLSVDRDLEGRLIIQNMKLNKLTQSKNASISRVL